MRGLWTVIPLSLALGGCATFDASRGHDQVDALVTERLGTSTGWGEGAPGGEAIAERIDALLAKGLDPDRAVAIALIHGPAMQETYASLGIAQADLMQAGLISNPSFSLDVGVPITHGLFELGGSLVQPIAELITLPMRKESASQAFQSEVFHVAHLALDTAARAKQEVYALQAATLKLAIAQEALALQEATADLAQRQRKAGNINAMQLAQRQVAYEALRLDVSEQELDVIAHRERINRLLGLHGERTGWKLAGALPSLPDAAGALEGLERRAIEQRLDVAAARKVVAQLQTGARLARTFRFVGTVDLGVHTHQDPNGPLLFGPDLTVELPLFDQRQAVIARLESQRNQAVRRLERLSVEARSEVRETRARLLTAIQAARHLEERVVPLQVQVTENALLQYNAMQFGLYELVDAKREELRARSRAIDARAAFWSAAAELERVVGGRLTHPDAPALPAEPPAEAHPSPTEASPSHDPGAHPDASALPEDSHAP